MSARGPRARAALVALAAATACARLPFPLPGERRPTIEVLAIGARFSTETSGQIDVRLAISNPRDETFLASLVTWEVWVDGHFFSTGLQSLSFEAGPHEERVLYLSMPLAFARMPLRPGPVRLLVGVRGRVTGLLHPDAPEQGFPFARQMEILSEGAPTFPLPGDPLE